MKWLLAFITLFSVTSLVVVPAAAADQRPRVDPELYMDPVSGPETLHYSSISVVSLSGPTDSLPHDRHRKPP